MGRKRKFRSVETFKNELSYTENLISGLYIVITAFHKIGNSGKFPGLREMLEDKKELLHFDDLRTNSLFELGYIRLFAAFESFMYEYLKELYIKYPKSVPKDKKIELEFILEWASKKNLIDFIIDQIAIENSYDLNTWEKTLNKSFGIQPLTEEDRHEFVLYNLVRNMLIHSGGKFNSKIARDHMKHFGATKPEKGKKNKFEVSKMDLEYDKMFNAAVTLFKKISMRLETNFS